MDFNACSVNSYKSISTKNWGYTRVMACVYAMEYKMDNYNTTGNDYSMLHCSLYSSYLVFKYVDINALCEIYHMTRMFGGEGLVNYL